MTETSDEKLEQLLYIFSDVKEKGGTKKFTANDLGYVHQLTEEMLELIKNEKEKALERDRKVKECPTIMDFIRRVEKMEEKVARLDEIKGLKKEVADLWGRVEQIERGRDD